ncbi:MAG: NAD(P)/FAD-dependent oxidoreductase [Deltaproteobacteria bacterium]|nr:NAD(P)/FAD-dependent oxidoreductase [Deltaproteobacteria bacterium]
MIIGGGAAGYFAAIRAAELNPAVRVILLEATRRVLTKVHLSGGGRCNVTHHCFDPAKLIDNYPRGSRELRSAFTRFQPRDTVAWFEGRGVKLKVEADGRMFPVTDQAATIATCLEGAAAKAGVEIRLGASVVTLRRHDTGLFQLRLKDGAEIMADRLMIATGSAPVGWELAAGLGHKIEPHVPSLFTFNIKDQRLQDLAGVAFTDVALTLKCDGSKKLERRGPMLITHWGLSGPAVLKLSAFGAVDLHRTGYQASLGINFLPSMTAAQIEATLRQYKSEHARRIVLKNGPYADLPRRFWETLVSVGGIGNDLTYADLTRQHIERLTSEIHAGQYRITGKGVFKEEFVSAGGVTLKEIDFRTLESRVVPGLYFAGEVLAVDGITGGFNFQAAWTTAWIAGQAMVASLGLDC